MMTCKLKPTLDMCKSCMEADGMEYEASEHNRLPYDRIPGCSSCIHKKKVYQLLNTGNNAITGQYAIIINDGNMETVPMDRVYDIIFIRNKDSVNESKEG